MKPFHSFCLLLFIATTNPLQAVAQQRSTDTIFYNKKWQICEAPIASFYRVGELVVDSFWYYRGAFKDYTLTDTLVMEGEYDSLGYKQGTFKYYYASGQLQAIGQFRQNIPFGLWQWWYPGGAEKAMISFAGDDQDFRFELFKNEAGDTLLKNGTGVFDWETNPFAPQSDYYVHGAFQNGKRFGKWKFIKKQEGIGDSFDFIEIYKDGKMKKLDQTAGRAYLFPGQSVYSFSFTPAHLATMESIAFDPLFRKGGDSLAGAALFAYLMEKKSLKLKVKQSVFDSAFLEMVRVLDSYRGKFNYQHQDIDGRIKFRLGEKGILEDLSITGNIDSVSRKFLLFLMGKFTNIDMPGTEDIAVESYHTIYFYSIEIKDYFPANLRDYVDRDFFISAIPKEQMVLLLNAQKKNIKRYIRRLL